MQRTAPVPTSRRGFVDYAEGADDALVGRGGFLDLKGTQLAVAGI